MEGSQCQQGQTNIHHLGCEGTCNPDQQRETVTLEEAFEEVLNVPSTVAAEMIVDVEDQATTVITEVSREEVEVSVRKLKNGKALGSDEIVAELVKNEG